MKVWRLVFTEPGTKERPVQCHEDKVTGPRTTMVIRCSRVGVAAVVVHCALCVAAADTIHDLAGKQVTEGKLEKCFLLSVKCTVTYVNRHVQVGTQFFLFLSIELALTGRAFKKAAMVFPLLISISTRLATLVPTFFLGLFGIFLFVAFSKKALIISLFALLLTYIDKHKRPKIVQIHQVGHHHHPFMDFESSHDFHPHPPKFFEIPLKKPLRKWPKTDHGPWSFTSPAIAEINMDSYLPQPTRRNDERVVLINATSSNSSTFSDEDPR